MPMQSRAEHQVALVTGGSRGIGKAICLALAAQGFRLFVNYSSSLDKANAVRDEILAFGGTAEVVHASVEDEGQVEAMVSRVVNECGRLDVLVNNAGVDLFKPALETTTADFVRILDINLKGTFMVGRAALRQMTQQPQGGRIINITSDFGYLGRAGFSAYCASKAGVIGLTRSWAAEFAPTIRVNAIAPGPVNTDMAAALTPEQYKANEEEVPLKRFAEPEEIASVAVFLASTDSSYLTGQTIGANGGTVMP